MSKPTLEHLALSPSRFIKLFKSGLHPAGRLDLDLEPDPLYPKYARVLVRNYTPSFLASHGLKEIGQYYSFLPFRSNAFLCTISQATTLTDQHALLMQFWDLRIYKDNRERRVVAKRLDHPNFVSAVLQSAMTMECTRVLLETQEGAGNTLHVYAIDATSKEPYITLLNTLSFPDRMCGYFAETDRVMTLSTSGVVTVWNWETRHVATFRSDFDMSAYADRLEDLMYVLMLLIRDDSIFISLEGRAIYRWLIPESVDQNHMPFEPPVHRFIESLDYAEPLTDHPARVTTINAWLSWTVTPSPHYLYRISENKFELWEFELRPISDFANANSESKRLNTRMAVKKIVTATLQEPLPNKYTFGWDVTLCDDHFFFTVDHPEVDTSRVLHMVPIRPPSPITLPHSYPTTGIDKDLPIDGASVSAPPSLFKESESESCYTRPTPAAAATPKSTPTTTAFSRELSAGFELPSEIRMTEIRPWCGRLLVKLKNDDVYLVEYLGTPT